MCLLKMLIKVQKPCLKAKQHINFNYLPVALEMRRPQTHIWITTITNQPTTKVSQNIGS